MAMSSFGDHLHILELVFILHLCQHASGHTSFTDGNRTDVSISQEHSNYSTSVVNSTLNGLHKSHDPDVAKKIKWWCPPGYHLSEDRIECKQMSCFNISLAQLPQRHLVNSTEKPEEMPVQNQTAECHPLLSDYKKCQKIPLAPSQYSIEQSNGTSLRIHQTNDTISIGQFVILKGGIASVCLNGATTNGFITIHNNPWYSEMTLNNMALSCMPFQILSEGFIMLPNNSAYASINSILFKPNFYETNSSSNGFVNVCYELATSYIQCGKKGLLFNDEFTRQSNMDLIETSPMKRRRPLGSYVPLMDEGAVIYCLPPVKPRNDEKRYLYGTTYIISTIFLFLALLVHLIFPSLNYHAEALLCHIVSMLLMFVCLSIRYFGEMFYWKATECYILFVVSYVSALGAFFWLSAIAFELWWVFANLKGQPHHTKARKMFILQLIYSWGIPSFLCILLLILDNDKELQENLGLPSEISHLCWTSSRKTSLVFFYIPLIVVLIANAIFFMLTVINLKKATKGADVLNKKVSRQIFQVFVKLFFVMGLFWVFEVISWFVELDDRWYYLTDVITGSQGVAIFIVYVCKKKTLKLIKMKLGYGIDESQVTETTTTASTKSMSYVPPIASNDLQMDSISKTATLQTEGKSVRPQNGNNSKVDIHNCG